MKSRIRSLTLTVHATVALLLIAAVLIVLGVFNGALKWDLFGPRVEAVLYAVFGSCVALAAVGVGLTMVLGTQETVVAFRAVRRHFDKESAETPEAPRAAYAKALLAMVVGVAVLIVVLSSLNHLVQAHRSGVFRRFAAEQADHFEAKVAALVAALDAPPRDHVPYEIYDLVKTLDNLAFVSRATLYVPDPDDPMAMGGYTAWREYRTEDGFARFFVAKDFEKAMSRALVGVAAELDRLNAQTGFAFYRVLRGADGRPVAVLRVDGNPRESFREYPLGS